MWIFAKVKEIMIPVIGKLEGYTFTNTPLNMDKVLTYDSMPFPGFHSIHDVNHGPMMKSPTSANMEQIEANVIMLGGGLPAIAFSLHKDHNHYWIFESGDDRDKELERIDKALSK